MLIACLVDTTRCIGCRSCQVACKQANGLRPEEHYGTDVPRSYPPSRRFAPQTYTFISFHEFDPAQGRPAWVFVKHQCMHCTRMACAEVCAPGVYRRTESGVVDYDPSLCIGCAACVDCCPFNVPTIDYWDAPTPHLRKCSFCLPRQRAPAQGLELDGVHVGGAALQRLDQSLRQPACAKACPSGAIQFGPRDQLLAEARRRIAASPKKYVNHIWGETEMGGTGWLYLAAVPFSELGFPKLPERVPPGPGQLGMRSSGQRAPT